MFVVRENFKISGVRFLELAGKPTDGEIQRYLDDERKRVARPAPSSAVTVLQITEVWTSTQRKMMRDFEAEVSARTKDQQLGLAIVVPNAVIRGAFTAYFWLAAPTYPTKMVPSAEAAYSFVFERLQEAGLSAPSENEYRVAAQGEWPARV